MNGIDIIAQRTWVTNLSSLPCFGAFADVTQQVKSTGSGNYLFSDMDLTQVIPSYCSGGTNYGGWSIVVVYESDELHNNTVTIYDGFEGIDSNNQNLYITLSGINVLDPVGAKVGFLVWEGDRDLGNDIEQIRINGANILSNPPLNPLNNIYNGTNSWTGANDLYNMDMDYFDIADYVNEGDSVLNLRIITGQDAVIINCIPVTLSSNSVDASLTINNIEIECNNSKIIVNYTIYNNTDSTLEIPGGTYIAFYADNTLLETAVTQNDIPESGSETGEIVLDIPESVGNDFVLKAVVDDNGTGVGEINESDETNNDDTKNVHLIYSPKLSKPEDIKIYLCDINTDEVLTVNLTLNEKQLEIDTDENYTITYYTSETDAENRVNPIENPLNYVLKTKSEQQFWIRVQNEISGCFSFTYFFVFIQQSIIPKGISPNRDGANDSFYLQISDVVNLQIYNRYGTIVYDYGKGYTDQWYGQDKSGRELPAGTYFYDIKTESGNCSGYVYLIREVR